MQNNLLDSQLIKEVRLAIVVSQFNEEICDGLLEGALKRLKECGVKLTPDILKVPGAFEIPLMAQRCAESKKYEGIICLGAVIRGGTPHFEYISQAVSLGLSQVTLKTGIPLSFGVLTTNDLQQAQARSQPDEFNKGCEAAHAVLEMIALLKRL